MSLLHSFYCWGSVATVLLSTLFFSFFGIENWKILSCIFAVPPLINAAFLTKLPILSPAPQEKGGGGVYKKLLSSGMFWIFLVMMTSAGAAEMAVQQWSSAFAETSLSVDKTTGDLLGMCGFSLTMALSRTLYGKFSKKIPLKGALTASSVMCIACYLMISLSDNPIIGFLGCIVCGFSVGIFWPGSFSLAASRMPVASTAMFALLSLAGDIGCTVGPTLAGFVSDVFGDDIQKGILFSICFPIILLLCLFIMRFMTRKNKAKKQIGE